MKTIAINISDINVALKNDTLEDMMNLVTMLFVDGYAVYIITPHPHFTKWKLIEFYHHHGSLLKENLVAAHSGDNALPFAVEKVPFWRWSWKKKQVLGITSRLNIEHSFYVPQGHIGKYYPIYICSEVEKYMKAQDLMNSRQAF